MSSAALVSRFASPHGFALAALPKSLLRVAGLFAAFAGLSATIAAQSCTTGLCLQQMSCPNNGTTTVSGVVYAPNGTDPLPNVLVYVPNATLSAFPAQVSCIQGGTPPSGSPIVGTTTAVNGSFTLTNVPAGTNIPLVIQTGRWRRQVTIPTVAGCTSTPFSTRFPVNQTEGDIPKIAIATGSEDAIECVLRKVGIADTEFTNQGGTGRVNLFKGGGNPGAQIDANTTLESVLTDTSAVLNQYDIVMFPCQGAKFEQATTDLNNLVSYAGLGGRVYATHFSFVWLYDDAFAGSAQWDPSQANLQDGTATVDTTYPGGQTLAQWLQDVGATTTLGQIAISTLRHDQSGINAPPSQSVLTLNGQGNPVMQFTFDTPIGTPAASQCGKVLYNEYHVENPTSALAGKIFPAECTTGAALSPQEQLLEFSLFDLSGNSVIPTLTPITQAFGTLAIGVTSAPQTFTFSNPSPFPVPVSTVSISGDFAVASNNCATVAASGSCQITATFTPTVVGARTGTLSVTSGQTILTSALTGNGVPDIQLSAATLNFGNIDLGASSASQIVTIQNAVPTTVALLPLTITGDYTDTNTCTSSLAPLASCTASITFHPSATGTRTGTITATAANANYGAATTTLTGNGVDFSLLFSPASGTVVAGNKATTSVTLSPIAGYSSSVTLNCTTNAPASTCTLASTSAVPASTIAVTIGTTSQYTVVGFSGLGTGILGSLSVLSLGGLFWLRRRHGVVLLRACMLVLLLAGAGAWTTGCSGKQPDQNNPYTTPGGYTYTVTGTDGFLTHSATYSLTVTSK